MTNFVALPWENMILNKDLIEGIIIEQERDTVFDTPLSGFRNGTRLQEGEEPMYRICIWLKNNNIGRAVCSLWMPQGRAYEYFCELEADLIFEDLEDGD